jgi:hypothetical protein
MKKIYIRITEQSGICSEDLANNFVYLREVNFESFSNKNLFTNLNEQLIDFNKIIQKSKLDQTKNIIESLQVIDKLNRIF